jgi:glycosyltransferase involved in cell wall biosynthesis
MIDAADPRFGSEPCRRVAIVTDAWRPQTNGVVNTLTRLVAHLEARGVDVTVIAPDSHRTLPLPFYPEIRVACDPWRAVRRLMEFRPDAVHIATEGPLGIWMRAHLARRGFAFTTSFHTRFPEYLSARVPVPLDWGYAIERWFHGAAARTLVGTKSLIRELAERRVGRTLIHWPRGVDTVAFHPGHRKDATYESFPRPIWLYAGRVAVEKNLEAFLRLDLPGTKVVVGDGPERPRLQARHPSAVWRGYRYDQDLAAHYASADCFVFPSITETFGNVLLEAMSSGLPIAAIPSPGPTDLVEEGLTGALSSVLYDACRRAILCSGTRARTAALAYGWDACHETLRAHLVRFEPARPGGVDAGTTALSSLVTAASR